MTAVVPHLQRADLSPNGRYVAAGYTNYSDETELDLHGVLIWDAATGKIIKQLPSSLHFVYDVAFSPDSKLLACACNNGLLTFDTVEFRQQSRVALGTKSGVRGSMRTIDISQFSAAITSSFWNPSTGREIAVLPASGKHLMSIGRDEVATNAGESVRIWDLRSASECLELMGHSGSCNAFAFTRDGSLLVSGTSEMGDATLWNLSKREAVKRWRVAGAEFIAFSPDERLMATGGYHKRRDYRSGTPSSQELLLTPGAHNWPPGRYVQYCHRLRHLQPQWPVLCR